jgi:transposase
MAYKEVAMWEILNVLRRIGRGEIISEVARVTEHDRKTVRRYVSIAKELGWVPGEEEPDEELAVRVFKQLRPVSTEQSPGETEQLLLPHTKTISDWLKSDDEFAKGLRLTKVHQLLARQGVDVPYSSLHRFAVKHCGFSDRRRITVRMADTEPGEVVQVDFGKLGLIPDSQKPGHRRTLNALVVTLIYSRHQYVRVSHSKKIPDLIDGLEDAWEFFGGVTERVILDNLKAAVTVADDYDPVFGRVFEEYARHRGFVIDATRGWHPQDKPHVENGIGYVRENFFRGEQWLDLEHVQRAAIRWCLSVAGTRIHGTTRKRPLAVFENTEKAVLKPLERERFDPPQWVQCKVHPDHCVTVCKALYTVPTRYIGRQVWVRADSKLVRVFYNGELIKIHERRPPGRKSIDYDDYPAERSVYAMRDPDRMIRQAREQGEYTGRFTQALLSGPIPWSKLRQAQRLMRLGKKYGWQRVEEACRCALDYDLINVKRLEGMLLDGLTARESEPEQPQMQLFPQRFERPGGSFSHHGGKDD